MREIARGELRAPGLILDVDIAKTYDGVAVESDRYTTAWCLVRENGVVVDARFFDVDGEASVPLDAVREHLCGVLPTNAPQTDGPKSDESLTVVIPTTRASQLPTVLKSLAAQTDRNFDVLIVDNSVDGRVLEDVPAVDDLDIRCCHEPLPGVSRARNAGLREVTSDLIAFIDDDEIADPEWVHWLRRGFAWPGGPDAVAGVMLPAELETTAQVNFERYGGFNKGRPMQPVELRAGTATVWDALYPLPSFGSGGNMAIRTDALVAIGGFDNRLGCPSIRGGDETRALSELLDRGSLILHLPPAVTWHYHRRTDEELENQFFGYSVGLTAFYMSAIASSPKNLLRIIGLLPRGLQRARASRQSGQPGGLPADYPEHLLRAGRRGLYVGAWRYLSESYRQRGSEFVTAERVSS